MLRQSGIFHRLNTETSQSLFVLLNPEANSKLHAQAQDFLRAYDQEDGPVDPFWLHKMLYSTYMPSWRQYIAWLERKFLPTVSPRTLISRRLVCTHAGNRQTWHSQQSAKSHSS